MRVFIITVDEPLYAPLYLQGIVDSSRCDFVGITALPLAETGLVPLLTQRLRLYGCRDFARALCRGATARACDLLGLRTGRRFYSVRRLAQTRGIPLYPTVSVNESAYLERLRRLNLDVLVCLAAGQRFENALLQTPKYGCLNVHSSLLPKYRGVDALFWAVLEGEARAGVTVHYMNERFDDGAILEQESFEIAPDDTLNRLYHKAIDAGSRCVSSALESIEAGTTQPRPNHREHGSYFRAPDGEAGRRFRKLGRRFF